jgi:hypothetical protein
MMIVIIMGHDIKGWLSGVQIRRSWKQKMKGYRDEEDWRMLYIIYVYIYYICVYIYIYIYIYVIYIYIYVIYIYIYIWKQHNETHQMLFETGGRGSRGMGIQWRSELCSKHTCIELSQWNALILLMYANSKIKYFLK